MIEPHSYLIFITASVLLCLAPGPDMIYLLTRTIAQGRRAGLVAALGINAGAYTHLAAAVLGLSAILAASSLAFTLIKWIGAVYLVYIGIQALRAKGGPLSVKGESTARLNHRAIFWQGFWSDVLNPKVALFYLAFLPQFVDPAGQNPTATLAFLGISLNIIGLVTNLVLVLAAGWLTSRVRGNTMFSAWLNKAMGAVFIALGVRLASERV